MTYASLIASARQRNCCAEENVPLSRHSTFRIGGPADVMITLHSPEDAVELLSLCGQNGVPFFFLGNGSNILFGDKGFRGVVFRFDRQEEIRKIGETTLLCPAGVRLQQVCTVARDNALQGLAFAYGIPGTVGGAVYMNAGAYGGEIGQVLTNATVLIPQKDGSYKQQTFSAEDLQLSYRHSALMAYTDAPAIVVDASFSLSVGNKEDIRREMEDLIGRRKEKQPLEYPSAGSFFKRPEGHFAGAMIEEAGLKGYRVGDAQVSEKHAGFVVNRGNATASQVRQLCSFVQDTVEAKTGIRLEPEVRFIGEF